MSVTTFADELVAAVGAEHVRANVPLAPLTTFRVGGPADWLVDARDAGALRRVAAMARARGIPVLVLGGGSNVLISDRGVRGVVVRLRGGHVASIDPGTIRADAGVTINGLVRWTIARGLAGLEAWAGTPGTVGGAIHGNAHFQGRLIGDLVRSVELMDPRGGLVRVARDAMAFGYDDSRVQRTGEVVVSADFIVSPGDPASLRAIARESLAYRKQTQPLHLPSAGCVFRNPDPAVEALPPGVPASAGALIDRAGLKGFRIGDASVSRTHANFFVNEGGATAGDIAGLIRHCRRIVAERFGVTLREEIVYVGEFDRG